MEFVQPSDLAKNMIKAKKNEYTFTNAKVDGVRRKKKRFIFLVSSPQECIYFLWIDWAQHAFHFNSVASCGLHVIQAENWWINTRTTATSLHFFLVLIYATEMITFFSFSLSSSSHSISSQFFNIPLSFSHSCEYTFGRKNTFSNYLKGSTSCQR